MVAVPSFSAHTESVRAGDLPLQVASPPSTSARALDLPAMGKKAAKSTRKFAASGQLKKTIQARRKHRDIKKKAEKRQATKGKGRQVVEDEDGDEDGSAQEDEEGVEGASGKCVCVHVLYEGVGGLGLC